MVFPWFFFPMIRAFTCYIWFYIWFWFHKIYFTHGILLNDSFISTQFIFWVIVCASWFVCIFTWFHVIFFFLHSFPGFLLFSTCDSSRVIYFQMIHDTWLVSFKLFTASTCGFQPWSHITYMYSLHTWHGEMHLYLFSPGDHIVVR